MAVDNKGVLYIKINKKLSTLYYVDLDILLQYFLVQPVKSILLHFYLVFKDDISMSSVDRRHVIVKRI